VMKLFRKIRQSLLDSGNLKRYLVYAIGEILLIMIGVLLAFQVNKWNEKRNNKKAEVVYYQNIKRQLHEDMGIISRNLDYNNLYMEQFDQATQIIEANDRSKTDTLVKISLNLFRYSDFHRASNIYETIVNSGQIKLLHNHQIIDGLQRLEEIYVYINKMEDIHLDIIKLIVLPDLIKTIEFSSRQAKSPGELYSFEFKNRFTILVDIMKEKNEVYNQAINKINEITELIDKELNPDNNL
jgi:hypothetical protein